MSKTGNLKSILIITLCMLLMFGSVMGGVWAANEFQFLRIIVEPGLSIDELDESPGVGIINILFLGIDDEGRHGLADAIMLVSVNGIENTVNVLSVPRDTRTQFGSRFGKINEVFDIGHIEAQRGNVVEPEEYVIRKIRELVGIPIHYFITIHMDGFANVIDILGGVEIDVPSVNRGGMFYNDPTPGGARININAGLQTLNGQDSLGFVRFRSYPDGDLGRIRAQQDFIAAFAAQHITLQNLPNISSVFNEMSDNVRTNFTAGDLLRYGGMLRNLNSESIQTFQVPGHAAFVGEISYFIPNLAQLDALVNEYFVLRLDREAEPDGSEDYE